MLSQSIYLGATTIFEWLRNRYGGSILYSTTTGWQAVARKAVEFLREIRRHVCFKHRQVKIALRFQSTMSSHHSGGTKEGVPESIRLERDILVQAIRIHNRSGREKLTKEDRKIVRKAKELCGGWSN